MFTLFIKCAAKFSDVRCCTVHLEKQNLAHDLRVELNLHKNRQIPWTGKSQGVSLRNKVWKEQASYSGLLKNIYEKDKYWSFDNFYYLKSVNIFSDDWN